MNSVTPYDLKKYKDYKITRIEEHNTGHQYSFSLIIQVEKVQPVNIRLP
jgi:hypothetical protein